MSLECWRGLTHGKYPFSPEFFLGDSCLHSFTDFSQVMSEVGSQISGAQMGKEKYFRHWKIVGLSPQARPGHFFPLWLSPGGVAIYNLNSSQLCSCRHPFWSRPLHLHLPKAREHSTLARFLLPEQAGPNRSRSMSSSRPPAKT